MAEDARCAEMSRARQSHAALCTDERKALATKIGAALTVDEIGVVVHLALPCSSAEKLDETLTSLAQLLTKGEP